MVRIAAVSLVLCTAGVLAAQDRQTNAAAKAMLANVVALSGQNCPVALTASRDVDGGLVETRPHQPVQGQKLDLSFVPLASRGVVQAQLTVHGMSGLQMIPAGRRSQRDATEDFTVAPNAADGHLYRSVILTKELTGIDFVEVNALTFADGTRWHHSANSACRVVPNGFKLVASSR